MATTFSFSVSPPFPLLKPSISPFRHLPLHPLAQTPISRSRRSILAAATPELGAIEEDPAAPPEPSIQTNSGVVEANVGLLKSAAKTRNVPAGEVLAALAAIKKENLDSSEFLEALGGTESPGRTWMLIFTAEGRLEKGRYFPLTAVQRFDAAAKMIENGVYLGPIGCLTFEGRFSWKKRILAFIFEQINIKIGPLGPFKINLNPEGEEKEPTTKDPFFVWFYVDEEIAVAQGRGGGIAFWCRCSRVT